MPLAPGTRLGPYEIVGQVGAGGMGEIWKARDTRLGREVAIKVLPPGLAADPDRLRRFEQEARTVASLSHPQILAIFDVGTHEGAPYLVTELLEGETLRERLAAGPLPVAKALDFAAQVARGLAAAHGKGIVHRDLKPENIFLTADGVKLLDFGLAKSAPVLLQGSQSELATQDFRHASVEGSFIGTVGYMSPEQVRGEAVDGRSDLFALGVLICEMLTGRQAFRGNTTADTLSAILLSDPADLDSLARTASPALMALAKRCLEKRREDRFSTAQDVAYALQALAHPSSPGAEAASAEKSIVVLPFENLSPDPDNAYFADGLTEELISDLSKVRALRVISRTSAMHFKGTTQQLPEIAQALNVRFVLEGSVRKVGSNLRITAQLIDAATDAHLWAEKFSGTLEEMFELPERLSRMIVEGLKERLGPEDSQRIGHRATQDTRVLEAWMRAMYEGRSWTQEGILNGFRIAEEALAKLGEDALLHAALGYLHYAEYDFGLRFEEAALKDAEAHSLRAIELCPELSQAHLAMGLVHYKRGNLAGFLRSSGRAVALERNGDALAWHALALVELGRRDSALLHADEAISRDPLTWWCHAVRGIVDLCDGQLEALAARHRDTVPRLAPEEPVARWWLAMAESYAGHVDQAIPAFRFVEDMDAGIFSDFSRLERLVLQGQAAPALEFLDASRLRDVARTDEYFPLVLANCLALAGHREEALDWLDQSICWLMVDPGFHRNNPHLRALHGVPRFEALMVKARERQLDLEGSL